MVGPEKNYERLWKGGSQGPIMQGLVVDWGGHMLEGQKDNK